ncbi:hypothetical protein ACFWY6_34885 [Streptomyces sp. NPDC059037]|uniref:hypothetical protein n=1 Tax=Streptomyces sp. NPDC059037 TaxID=3346710 RepID=UPI00368672B8
MAAAALAAAVAIPLGVATPAYAGQVRCSSDTTSGAWKGRCFRYPTDGDSGGVSGSVHNYKPGTDAYARNYFHAKGEYFTLHNETSHDAYFSAWRYVDEEWKVIFPEVKLSAGESRELDFILPEGQDVAARVCVKSRGCVTLDSYRS